MPIYQVRLEDDEGGWIVARCLHPKVTSQGRSREAALRNVKEAIECYIEATTGAENIEVEVAEVDLIAA